jgi:hypothetical protein
MEKGFLGRRSQTGTPLNVEKVYEDTGTEKSYGELTWSNKQILCDTLQNSLDAETRKFISEIEAESIVNIDENLAKAANDPDWRNSYLEMLNHLYTLSYRAGDLDETEKSKLIEKIHKKARGLGVTLRNVDVNHFKTSERPALPQITYAVRDCESGKILRGLSEDELLIGRYADSKRYPLFEWSINDSGSGYDVTKSVLYLPTKTSEQFSRGVFGEGLKVNQAAISRVPGVSLRIHSQYEEESGDPVAWVRHVQAEDEMVVQRGINVRNRVAPNTGSGTTIRFLENQEGNKELREVLDPRITPVKSVAAEFGKKDFKYPLGTQDDGVAYPGISLNVDSGQFLQGLSIGTPDEHLLFSYDFHNRNVIAGRDRKHLNSEVLHDDVIQFWEHVSDPTLCHELLKRLLFARSRNDTPERSVFFNACTHFLKSEATAQDNMLLREFVQSLGLKNDVQNYIAPYADSMVSHIDPLVVNVIQLELSCTEDELQLMQEALIQLNPTIKFLTLQKETHTTVSREIKDSEKKEEREFTDAEKIFMKGFSDLFKDVMNNCSSVSEVTEKLFGHHPTIDSNIRYEIQEWSDSIGFYVEAKNNVRTITCLLPGDGSKPDKTLDLTDPDTLAKVQAEVQILYLASTMLGEGTINDRSRTYHEYAQMYAQKILDESVKNSPVSSDSLYLLYRKAGVLMAEQLKGLQQQSEREGLEDTVVNFRVEAARLSCTPERLLEIGRWAEAHDEVRGSENLKQSILGRVLVEGEHVIFFEENETGTLELKQVELTEASKIGEWSGYPYYQISEERYVIPVPTQEKATLARQGNTYSPHTYAVCDDSIVSINSSSVYNTLTRNQLGISLDKGCINFNRIRNLDEYVYSPVPQERSADDMSIETGLMKSPITLEYISAHWSDPERIFQDLGQNHMDAGGLEERYLVLRDEKKMWVSKNDLGDSLIIGYELSDNGLGYSPSGISNMGHTRKRNPFLTGKNGEGLKLAAASAKKNGFDIVFASYGEDGAGKETAWQTDVLITDEPYTHEGKTNYAKRLGFQVTTQPKEILGGKSAITRLELPDNSDTSTREQWASWAMCIDPRNEDSLGNGGIDRILITKEGSQGSYDTKGPITVLYDRPGAIFENGMLVRTSSQDEQTFTLGWNFPSITSTRERTHIDLRMAGNYIRYYFMHTTDERAVRHLLRFIQPHHVDVSSVRYSDDEFTKIVALADSYTKRRDTDASFALPDGDDYPSLKLFQRVARKMYPNKILFSYELARETGITMSGSMRHIREEDRLNVSREDYRRLRHIFPTMHTYMDDIRNSKINIEPDLLSPLRTLVGSEIDRIKASIDRISQNPTSAPLLNHVLQMSNMSQAELITRLDDLRPEVSANQSNDVFLMADDSQADGLASDGVGLRISLLNINNKTGAGRLVGVLDHELCHKMLGARDYSKAFILLLFLLAQDALESRSYPSRRM